VVSFSSDAGHGFCFFLSVVDLSSLRSRCFVVGVFFFLFLPRRFPASILAPYPTKERMRRTRSSISLCSAYPMTLATNQGRGASPAILRSFLSKGVRTSGLSSSSLRLWLISVSSDGHKKYRLAHIRAQILSRWGR